MLPFSRLMANTTSAPGSMVDLEAYDRHMRRDIKPVAHAPKAPRFTQPAAGIAVVSGTYPTNMDAYVVPLTPREGPEERMLLVDGHLPTFVSRGRDSYLNKKQRRAQLEENNKRALGQRVPPKKSELRRRMETDGCILFTDGYTRAHSDSKIAAVAAPYQRIFTLEPPECKPDATLKKRHEELNRYLIAQAELEHRPLFRRIASWEVYGEPCEYMENAHNAQIELAVYSGPSSPVLTHTEPTACASKMRPTWSMFSLDQGASSSQATSRSSSRLQRSPVAT